ncbi:MAG: polysaccharide deacetylase family protein [Bacilli bacterium]|nr:polysaccharide deacetylase family protein [Bacilli bacterium]
MKKVSYIIKSILSLIIVLLFSISYVYIYHINKDNKYLNDFKYKKTVYYENQKINKKIAELVKRDVLVSNNVLGKKYVNLLAYENGVYTSYIYGYYNGKLINIDKIFKSEEAYQLFINKTKEMCYLKYPVFACDDLMTNGNMSYEILDNKINVYFNKSELLKDVNEDYFVEVNYHELIVDDADILNYVFSLDTNYTNPNTYKINPNKPTIAFTFDDGPGPYTKEIVDNLVSYHYKATFFVVGNRLGKYGDVLKYQYKKGMEIGNHSYDHSSLPKLKNGKLESNINATNEAINNLIGEKPFLIRPPYGAINDYVKESLPNAFILWNVDTNDWLYRDADYVKNYILTHASDGDVILMHDIHQTSKEGVINVLKDLYLRGFQVTTVSELASIKGKTLEQHSAYRGFK